MFYPKTKCSLNKDVIPDNVITKYCAKLLYLLSGAFFKKKCLITRLTLSSHRVSLSIGWNYKQSCPPGYYRRLCRSLCEGDVSECHHLIGCTTTKVFFLLYFFKYLNNRKLNILRRHLSLNGKKYMKYESVNLNYY